MIDLPKNNTYLNSEWIFKAVNYLDLIDLKTSKDLTIYRIWINYRWIVELKVNTIKSINLSATAYISGNKSVDSIHGGLIFEKETFSDSLANAIKNYLELNNISCLLDDSQIPRYSKGLDGTTIDFEISNPQNYRLFSYWMPDQQKNIKEAIVVNKLQNKLKEELRLQQLFDTLVSKLPPGTYSSGMMEITIEK